MVYHGTSRIVWTLLCVALRPFSCLVNCPPQSSPPTICAQKLTNCWYVCTRKSTKIQFPKNKRVATFICQKYFYGIPGYAKISELKKFCFTIFYEVDAAMHQM